MKEKVNDALKQHFRPEFLNRIDETIVFHELSKAEVTQIVDLMIKRTSVQLEAQGIGIELTDGAKSLLVDRGYDPTLGARPLRRAIQRLVEDPLSERLLYKKFRAGEIVIVDAEDDPESPKGEDMIVFRAVEGFEPPTGRAGRGRPHRLAPRRPLASLACSGGSTPRLPGPGRRLPGDGLPGRHDRRHHGPRRRQRPGDGDRRPRSRKPRRRCPTSTSRSCWTTSARRAGRWSAPTGPTAAAGGCRRPSRSPTRRSCRPSWRSWAAQGGPFRDFTLTRDDALRQDDLPLEGTVDLSGGIDAFGDDALRQALGGTTTGRTPEQLAAEAGRPLPEALRFTVRTHLPGGGTEEWTPVLGQPAQQIEASSASRRPRAWLFGFAAVLAAAGFLGTLYLIARYNRMKRPPSYVHRPGGPSRPWEVD